MTSIAKKCETPDQTAASPTATYEPVTKQAPTAWSAGRRDEWQSETFRALAWSQDGDSLAEPLPYTGEEHFAPEMSSRPAPRIADAPQAVFGTPRFRRPGPLSLIATGIAAVAAAAGLVLTIANTDGVPTTTSPVVIHPAKDSTIPQPTGGTGHQGGLIPPAPAPARAAAPSGPTIPQATRTLPISIETPSPAVVTVTPGAPLPAAPDVTAPAAAAPEEAPAIEEPPVATPPVVSLPEEDSEPAPEDGLGPAANADPDAAPEDPGPAGMDPFTVLDRVPSDPRLSIGGAPIILAPTVPLLPSE